MATMCASKAQAHVGLYSETESLNAMKLGRKEKKLLRSIERGQWRSVRGLKRERTRYARYAEEAVREDRQVKIRK